VTVLFTAVVAVFTGGAGETGVVVVVVVGVVVVVVVVLGDGVGAVDVGIDVVVSGLALGTEVVGTEVVGTEVVGTEALGPGAPPLVLAALGPLPRECEGRAVTRTGAAAPDCACTTLVWAASRFSPGARTIEPRIGRSPRPVSSAAGFPNGTSFAASRATVTGRGSDSPAAASSGIGSATAKTASAREGYRIATAIEETAVLPQRRRVDRPQPPPFG
jgi:hypothetical protein